MAGFLRFRPLSPAHGHHVVGHGLVHDVIEPVREEQVGVAAPADDGGLGIVVVGIVVFGDGDWQARRLIPPVFLPQGLGVVLRVAGDEQLAAILSRHGRPAGSRPEF